MIALATNVLLDMASSEDLTARKRLPYGATRFLTFDQEDFAPFAAEIQLIHPNDLAGTQDLA